MYARANDHLTSKRLWLSLVSIELLTIVNINIRPHVLNCVENYNGEEMRGERCEMRQ